MTPTPAKGKRGVTITQITPTATLHDNKRLVVEWFYPTPDQIKALPVHGDGHWSKSSGLISNWKFLAAHLTKQAGVTEPWECARLTIKFYKPPKQWRLDFINGMQRMKSVIDGVVKGGLIYDDTDKYLKIGEPESYKGVRDRPRIELVFDRIEPMEGAA